LRSARSGGWRMRHPAVNRQRSGVFLAISSHLVA
jgi:hypothetical protein